MRSGAPVLILVESAIAQPSNSSAAADGNRASGGPSAIDFRLRLPRLSGKTLGPMRKIILLAVAVLLTGCEYDPFAHEYTTVKPAENRLVGRYLPDDETRGRLRSTLQLQVDPRCELVLNADHTFSAKNIPRCWFPPVGNDCLPGVTDVSGDWSLGRRGSWWSVNLNAHLQPGGVMKTWNVPASVRGDHPPYVLHLTIGDPDSGDALAFVARRTGANSALQPAPRRPLPPFARVPSSAILPRWARQSAEPLGA